MAFRRAGKINFPSKLVPAFVLREQSAGLVLPGRNCVAGPEAAAWLPGGRGATGGRSLAQRPRAGKDAAW